MLKMNAATTSDIIPLSLYIHTPWCIQKCPYCDFNSHALKQPLPEADYISALIKDFDLSLSKIQERPITSIFIGGGTPSLFSPSAIHELLKAVQQRIPFKPNIEITLEANPGTVEQTRFEGFLEAGVNRLSLGIQSFNDLHLKKLGRIHGNLEAQKAIEAAYTAGFQHLNLDIMYGLPHQTLDEAITDLKTAISFSPGHLSWYQLTLEENTPFFHHPPAVPSDELCWEIFQTGQKYLEVSNYHRYEISAYAKEGRACQHNLNYWEFGDYLGIGAGACSKLTDLKQKTICRILKKKHPQHYLTGDQEFIAQEKIVPLSDLPLEFMMNALRLNKPLNIHCFEQRTGLSINTIQPILNLLCKKGWLLQKPHTIQLTDQGYLFLNDVLEAFMVKAYS